MAEKILLVATNFQAYLHEFYFFFFIMKKFQKFFILNFNSKFPNFKFSILDLEFSI